MAKTSDGVYWKHYAAHDPSSSHFMANRAMDSVAQIELLYRNRLQEMSVNRFKWSGLPDGVDERFIEMMLFEQGLIVACEPKELPPEIDTDKLMFLRATPSEGIDYQYNPLAFHYYGNQMFDGELPMSSGKIQPIYANRMRVPDSTVIWWYARRLAEAETTIDINLKNARRTRLLAVPETQKLTGINALNQIDRGEPAVLVSDEFDKDMFSAIDLGMPSSFLSDVPAAKNKIMNDCMTWLGIDNANQDKKERLVASEVDANGEQVSVNRAIALNERRLGVERVNKLFGTNISVDWAADYVNDRVKEEGDDNGNIHDDASGDSRE